ncbi:MAG: glutamine--fructose-6-phosphate transaminase (isomerizing) [Deltaproteobacteria bacterium]|nr:glutamine--fructose-6-phosphate transaminase (isomerizing) [Deltaproteobacteria bacterium]
MCGIVGYVGRRDCAPILLDGLRKLEYRGYDSAGIAIVRDGDIQVRRSSGKLANLEAAIRAAPVSGALGIGHTRWATHGRPSEENAHPHRAGDVVVVHNGIIENYLDLRNELRAGGRTFSSETDTEVLSHLIDRERGRTDCLLDAVRAALARVHGSYAIAVVNLHEPGRIVVAKNSSPLIVGIGDGEMLVASDIPALLGFTRDVFAVEDGEFGEVTESGYRAFSIATGKAVERKPFRVDLTPAMAEKGGYKHFMLKEIHEQPRAVIDTMRGRVAVERGDVVFDAEGPGPEVLAGVARVHLAACGTSWHAALVGRHLVTRLAGVPVEVHLASEFDAGVALTGPGDLFVSISQSGETLDTVRTQKEAKAAGLPTVAICNVVASTISRDAHHVVFTHAGPEISVASTKAFTTQIVALYLLALAIGRARGLLAPEVVRGHVTDLLTAPGLIEDALRLSGDIRKIAKKYMGFRHTLFLGRGLLHPVALEGALKLKEISYIHAEGYSAGEMKHGPIALIDEDFPTVVLVPRGPWHAKTIGNLEEVKARNGRLIALATAGDEDVAGRADDVIRLPECPPFLLPLVATVPLQLLAYHMADLKGTDVDQPRNLAKSVTVE